MIHCNIPATEIIAITIKINFNFSGRWDTSTVFKFDDSLWKYNALARHFQAQFYIMLFTLKNDFGNIQIIVLWEERNNFLLLL